MNAPVLLLDMAALEKVISFGKTKIEQMIKEGEFPAPIYIGRSRRWPMAQVEEWVRQKLSATADTKAR